ncbi:MAG: ABC transporter substrate-binding protein [Caldilineaceae bacterium SB0668_bin_21]|nr:ABC transporter substrate-binding protein [Caldilineaceae bacterium SB0668_bin_21]MYC21880.1 ABC transporter substrate-binding protein [Caldilineaceae bacterium SB0662_bin_25]
MNRSIVSLILIALLALIVSACVAPAPAAPAAEEEQMEAEEEPMAAEEVEAGSEAEFEQILACVEENFPAESYFTNELLPAVDATWEPMECDSVDSIKVGMPWVLNDEEAPWYNAIELGYFADVCLEVELVAGGPGLDHLQTLAGGAVDIAVVAGGSTVPSLVASPTPADVVAVGTFLKHSPYIWLGLDPDTPQDQRSDKVLTPQDFVGKKVGLQPGNDYLFEFIANKHGIPHDEVELMPAGFTPDPVLVGAMDYIGAWIVNQPRLMEEQGFMNWVAFNFSDWGWDGYGDVTVVRRETLEENPDLVRRFLAAQTRGLNYLLENPDESAEIAVVYGVDAQLTKEQALRRFELQEALVLGSDDLPVSHMSADRWNMQVASMIQYDQLQVEACE